MNMRYKIDDIVKVKSLDWYNKNKDRNGYVNSFTEDMAEYCGSKATIVAIDNKYKRYKLDIDDWAWWWSEDMFEEFMGDGIPCDTEYEWKNELECPDGYQFIDENGNVINATKIVLEKKKKEYPTTYEECCKVMNFCYNPKAVKMFHKEELIRKFQFLLLYRDAYWKIAGEQMGLGKAWEPDWNNEEWPDMAYISYDGKSIDKENGFPCCNMILIFPTEEMRDAFYDNFKNEIEQCKELL